MINEAALRAVRNNRTVVTEADLEEIRRGRSSRATRKRTPCCPTRKSRRLHTTRSVTRWSRRCRSHSAPVHEDHDHPAEPPGRSATRCRWTTGEQVSDVETTRWQNKICDASRADSAAEEVVFGEITTGASNDIEQATKLARAMITRYGMSEEFDMVALETVNNQYLGGDTSLACSAATQQEIDKMVVSLVKSQHEKAIRNSQGQPQGARCAGKIPL